MSVNEWDHWNNIAIEFMPQWNEEERTAFADKCVSNTLYENQSRENRGKEMHKRLKKACPEHCKSLLITLSIDKNLTPTDAVVKQFEVIDKLQKANYKYFSSVAHRFEYFSKSGWNPHIHICTDKNNTPGQVAQSLRRKLLKGMSVYNIDVAEIGYQQVQKYINGDKADDKMVYVAKDAKFRSENDIEDIYFWNT